MKPLSPALRFKAIPVPVYETSSYEEKRRILKRALTVSFVLLIILSAIFFVAAAFVNYPDLKWRFLALAVCFLGMAIIILCCLVTL